MTHPYFFTWSKQADAHPIALVGGEGCWFDTADTGRWLDLGSLTFHVNAGHGERRIVEAIKAQADQLCLSMPSADFPAKRVLAERLLEIAGEGYSRVFFTLGGSEANENAIKIARLVTGRYKVVSRFRSYHGATLGAISLSGDYRRGPIEPGIIGALRVMDCYCDRCPFGKVLESCNRECASNIGEVLRLEGGVGAVILEPMVGANGVLVPPDDYWPRVREACDANGTLLIADEVLTGFGRTGRWFGHQHFDVKPDMITVAKGLTGGYGTLGAVIVHARVAQHFDHNVLYAGLTAYAHPLGCAAALAALEVYESDGMIDNAAALEPQLLGGLHALVNRHPGKALFARGRGLLGAVEIDATDAEWAAIAAGFKARRVHIFVKRQSQCVILAPPLCIDEATLQIGLDHVTQVLDEVWGQPGSDS